jgi:DNA-binding beta-propeller fold protein YncE
MRRRFVSLFGALCSSLLVFGGVLTLVPLHGEYDAAAPHLYLSSGHGITAIDANDGTEAFTSEGGVASGDWQRLISATPGGNGTTSVRSVDAFDGDLESDTTLTGTLDVRAVSYRGDLVALSPDARAVNGRQPGRSSTRLVVVSTIGGLPTRTYDVAANIEPEAFSTDGGALFVIQYLPPMDPDRYQVRRLDLATGELTLVPSVDGANQGQMPGIARTSVMSPDGRRRYTLYTSEENGQRYSFVHVLDLAGQWAHCVDLPLSFGGDPEAMGIAINPTGSRVYVADVAAGKLATVDTTRVALDTVSRMPIRGVHAPPAVAAGMGRVYVAAQRNLVALATGTAITYFHATLESPVRGLHAVAAGGTQDQLYVAERRSIVQLDGTYGHQVSAFAAKTPRLTGLGYQYPPASGDTYQCAC